MKRDGTPHKGGFVHRSSKVYNNKRSYGMGIEVAACGVRKVDGYSVHPARKLTTCPDCKRITNKSMSTSAQVVEAGGKVPKKKVLGLNLGAPS